MAYVSTTVTSFREKPRWAGIKEVYVKIQVDGEYNQASAISFDPADFYVGTVKAIHPAPFLDDNSKICFPVFDGTDEIHVFRNSGTGGLVIEVPDSDTALSGNAFYVTIVGVGI